MPPDMIPNTYHSDHLFLLVGKNPLPNYVAARLLAKTDSTIWLLHSDDPDEGPSGTKRAAEELETALLKRELSLTVRLEGIPSSNNLGIETRIREILDQNRLAGTIGLNYTGGTKVMSVHVYRVLEQELAKYRPRPVFSYLDPRKLALCVDGQGTASQQTFPIMQNPALRQLVEISLDELAALHGYKRVTSPGEGWADADETPGLLSLCSVIAEIHTSEIGFRQYRQWIFRVSREKVEELPDPESYPHLVTLLDALDEFCGGPGQATPQAVAAKLRPLDKQARLVSCPKWFYGTWLEEYSAASLLRVAANLGLESREKNLEYQCRWEHTDKFEFDAAAMLGYQIFGISCIASHKKSATKEHFFEAFIRSRQLGGDEARTGLVCLIEDPAMLEREISRAWDTEGQLRVFGRHDLKDLATAFERWFETASR